MIEELIQAYPRMSRWSIVHPETMQADPSFEVGAVKAAGVSKVGDTVKATWPFEAGHTVKAAWSSGRLAAR